MLKEVLNHQSMMLWPSLSLLIFFVMMVIIGLWMYRPRSTKYYNHIRQQALEDGSLRRSPDESR